MSRLKLVFWLLILAAAVATFGCGPHYRGGADVVYRVPEPPPPPRSEVVVARPGPGLVWVPGHWEWRPRPHSYVWIPGRWVRPPHHRAVWVPPHFERYRGRIVFIPGHWR